MASGQVAVLVASVSLALSISGFIWQLALYRLSGARIRIVIARAVMTHRGAVLAGHRGRWPKLSMDMAFLSEGDLWVELARIDVANIGRTAIWVSDIGVDFGRDCIFKMGQRTRVSLRPLAIGEGLVDNSAKRLEPGQATVMYFPIVEITDWARKGRRVARGTATLAGRRAKLSPLRHALVTRQGDPGRLPGLCATKEVLVFQLLVNNWPTSDVDQLYEAWLGVWIALSPEMQKGTVEEALEPYFASPMSRVVLAQQLRRLAGKN
jgi:hypothetical protein